MMVCVRLPVGGGASCRLMEREALLPEKRAIRGEAYVLTAEFESI